MIEMKDEYEIDSSDEEDVQNTVGNVPLEWYNNESHIGYDITGRRLMKPSANNKGEIDSFLDNFDNVDRSRVIKDPRTGQDVILSDGDIMLIRSLCNSRGFISSLGDDFVNDWFTREKMETPISAIPPQKTSFIPSLSDKKKVSLIVHAIKTGRMKMPTPVDKDKYLDADYNDVINMEVPDVFSPDYGKWKLSHVPEELLEWLPPHLLPNYQTNYHRSREIIRAPKEAPPGNDMSYRPPGEYLLDDKEKKVFISRFFDKSYNPCKHLDEKPLFPKQYDNLRSLGFHPQLIIDDEKRIKDLLHAARVVKDKVNSSTEKMLEQTRPEEETMRPYPNAVNADLINVDDVVLSISVSYCGKFVATVGYKAVKIWSTAPILLKRCYTISSSETDLSLRNPSVSWNTYSHLLAIATVNTVKIINPALLESEELEERVQEWWKQYTKTNEDEEPLNKKSKVTTQWSIQTPVSIGRLTKQSSSLIIQMEDPVLEMSWHSGGDYLLTISGKGKGTQSGGAAHIHRLSKCASQEPFSGSKCQWLTAKFHNAKNIPVIYLAECNSSQIKVYNLAEKKLVKTLQLSGKPSVMEMHPNGNHLIVGTFEGNMCWFDLDMGITPFKTMNLKRNSIRSVSLHSKYPLLSCTTANGSVVIIYARVFTSYDKNPVIHAVELFEKLDKVGDMYASVFDPIEPTLYCGGADKTMRVINSCH